MKKCRWGSVRNSFCVLFGILIWGESDAYSEVLYRGLRAAALGNAITAIAEGEEAIFYNPAALAGVNGLSFNLLGLSLEASDDGRSEYSWLMTEVNNAGIETANKMMGKSLYARAQVTSSIVAPSIGIAGIGDQQVALRFENPSYPVGTIGLQSTYGIQLGFGTRAFKFKKRHGEIRVGVALKALWRSGGYSYPDLVQMMALDTSYWQGRLNNFGMGLGGDFGLQFVRKFRKGWTVQLGSVATDIGGTSFSSGADTQKSNLIMGAAGIFQNRNFKATLSYDYDHLFEEMDWRKKTHLGFELKFPFLSLYSGLNQFAFSYGIGLDFGLLRVIFASYAEQLGTAIGQLVERRMLGQLAIKFEF